MLLIDVVADIIDNIVKFGTLKFVQDGTHDAPEYKFEKDMEDAEVSFSDTTMNEGYSR